MRWLIPIACAIAVFRAEAQPEPSSPRAIQSIPADASRPFFVPTHPRVTTTVRFPDEIGAPDGAASLFTEDAASPSGEYFVAWQPGDSYFTIMPLKEAGLCNLNVPYHGETYVFYFHPVPDPLKAVALVNVVPAGGERPMSNGGAPRATPGPRVARQAEPPARDVVDATPARLVGFLDRLKLIHATPVGAGLSELVKTMDVQVAISREARAAEAAGFPTGVDGVSGVFPRAMNDGGLFQIILLRAVRDRRINCIGFICLVRNTSSQVLAFDVNSFGARAGAEYHVQRVSDAAPILKPGEQVPAYFVIQPPQGSPLLPDNDWKLSVDLVSPRLNPGAAISRGFGSRGGGS